VECKPHHFIPNYCTGKSTSSLAQNSHLLMIFHEKNLLRRSRNQTTQATVEKLRNGTVQRSKYTDITPTVKQKIH